MEEEGILQQTTTTTTTSDVWLSDGQIDTLSMKLVHFMRENKLNKKAVIWSCEFFNWLYTRIILQQDDKNVDWWRDHVFEKHQTFSTLSLDQLEKIIIPVNLPNEDNPTDFSGWHWILVTVFVKKKIIVIYDSLESASFKKPNTSHILDKYDAQIKTILFVLNKYGISKNIKHFIIPAKESDYGANEVKWELHLNHFKNPQNDGSSCGYFVLLVVMILCIGLDDSQYTEHILVDLKEMPKIKELINKIAPKQRDPSYLRRYQDIIMSHLIPDSDVDILSKEVMKLNGSMITHDDITYFVDQCVEFSRKN